MELINLILVKYSLYEISIGKYENNSVRISNGDTSNDYGDSLDVKTVNS